MANDNLGFVPEEQPSGLGSTLGRYLAIANKKLVPMAAATTAGAGAGALAGGVGAVPGALGGLASYGVAHLADLPVAAYNNFKPESWPTSPYPGVGFDNAVNSVADRVLGHNIQPQTPGERIFESTANAVGDAASGNALGSLLKGAASPAVRAVGQAFAPEKVVPTLVASGISGAAAGTAHEAAPNSTLAPIIAGLVAPAAIPATSNLMRVPFRGGATPAEMQGRLAAFNEIGSSPTMGQATGNNSVLRLENYLSKFPGAAGLMERRAQEQAQGVASAVDEMAGKIAPMNPAANSTIAGEAAVKGIEDKFIPASRRIQTRLYDAFEKGTPLESGGAGNSSNYQAILAKLGASVAPGTETGEANLLKPHNDVQDLITRNNNDIAAGIGDLSYQAKKAIRTRLGEQMVKGYDANGNKVDNATIKRIYGALTKDMEADANAAGVGDQFRVANANTVQLNDKLESLYRLLNTADRSGEGTMVAQVTAKGINGPRQGVNKQLQTLTDSLPTGDYKTFATSFLNDLARPKASAQNAAGDAFSIESLVTNWNSYSPEAKKAIFGRLSPDHVDNLNKVMQLASDIKDSSKFMQNRSGTGQVVNYGMAAAALGQGVAGNTRASLGFLIPMAVGNVGARALTSPRFVRWAANSSNVPAGNLLPQLDRLAEQARKAGDEDGAAAFGAVKDKLQGGNADLGFIPDDHSDLGFVPDKPSRSKRLTEGL